MSQELVTSDGLIAAGPSTSHDDYNVYNAGDDPMELELEELSGNESNLLDEGSTKSRLKAATETRNPESLEHVLFRLENAATAKSTGPRKKNSSTLSRR